MQKVEVYNQTKKEMILQNAFIADTFFSRLRGLIGKQNLEADSGVVIDPCSLIHTFGMNFPIDVIFVNKKNMVCRIIPNMPKSRISPIVKEANMVIEATAGTIDRLKICINDNIEIKRV